MFNTLDGMRWPHAGPCAGSIYDQDPDWVEKMNFIFSERAKFKNEESKKQEKESLRQKRQAASKGGGGKRTPRRPAGR